MALISNIKGSFKTFPLLFCQAKMIFVITWLFDHFTLKPVPLVNGVFIITFVNHLHFSITNFNPLLMLFKLLVLTSNNIVLVNFSAILFDEIRHVAETSTVRYVSVCCELVNLFIEPQNFLLIFFICKLKGLYLIVMICDSLLMFSLDLFNSCIKPTWYKIFQDVLLKCFSLVFLRFFNDMHNPKDLSRPPTDVSICLRPKNFPT